MSTDERDPVDVALGRLRDGLAAHLDVPPYEQIERRQVRRRRRQLAMPVVVFVVLAALGVGLFPLLSDQFSSTSAVGRPGPLVTVTVTVPAAVEGPLTLRDTGFVGAGFGAALGQRCDSQGLCDTVVEVSTDGGAHFSNEHVVTHVGAVGPTKITVTKSGEMFAYDPGLYVTEDSGATWKNLTPTGYAIKDIAISGSDFTALGVSIDGIVDLLRNSYPDLSERFSYIPVDGADASARLQQLGQTNLVTVGSGVSGSNAGSAGSRVIVVQEGGGDQKAVPLPAGCSLPSFSAPAPDAWWLLCADPPASGGRVKRAYLSTDSGQWVAVTAPPTDGEAGTITALNASAAYVSGPDSALYVTTDAGRTWTVARPSSPAGFGEPHVRNASTSLGRGSTWVVAGSTVWRLDVDGNWQATNLS